VRPCHVQARWQTCHVQARWQKSALKALFTSLQSLAKKRLKGAFYKTSFTARGSAPRPFT